MGMKEELEVNVEGVGGIAVVVPRASLGEDDGERRVRM
jgi:hypothetical protein